MPRKILKYNELVQKAFKCKTEPRPWLHFALITSTKTQPKCGYVIYIWDTREIVEEFFEEQVQNEKYVELSKRFNGYYDYANDNHKPLVGKNAKYINLMCNFRDTPPEPDYLKKPVYPQPSFKSNMGQKL